MFTIKVDSAMLLTQLPAYLGKSCRATHNALCNDWLW